MTSPDITIDVHPDVFNDIYTSHLGNMTRTQVFYGGSGSGKSVFLSQRAVLDVAGGGRNYLICRDVGRTIRKSVFNEVRKAIADFRLIKLFTVNKTEMIITCANGYQIMFSGLDDAEKIKSITPQRGVITDIWIEEATETDRDTIKSLYKRQRGGSDDTPKRLTLSFNPIIKTHWIYEDYFSTVAWADDQNAYMGDDVSILKTWYIHNRFLTGADIHDLEHEQDDYYYQVYTLGNWGVLGNVIFTNWETRDLSAMAAQFTNTRNGLDFGFSSDPAAVTRSHYDRKTGTIYVFDELYERGLTNDRLGADVVQLVGRELVTCDSAEPKSIAELRIAGVTAQPSKKGKDSVMHGIQWLQQQKIIIDSRCIDHRNEFTQYQWKKDRDGNYLRQPVDKHNHLIDALRYAYETDMLWAKSEIEAQEAEASRWSVAGRRNGGGSRWKI